jgi:hypothetical protein
VPFLHSLHYDDRTDHLGGRRDVEIQRLAVSRWREYQRVRKCRLQLVKRILGLDGPGEALVLLQESVEGQAFLAEPRNETAQSGQAAQHLLHPF